MTNILSTNYKGIRKLDSAYKYSELTMQHYELAEKNKEKTFQLLYENDYTKAQELHSKIKKEDNDKRLMLFVVSLLSILIVGIVAFSYTKKEQHKAGLVIEELQNQKQEEKQVAKKEYNISVALEAQILKEIEKANTSLLFLQSDFSVNTIANLANVNTTYVSFVFNKHYKLTFKQYYTKARLTYVVNKLKKDPVFRKYSIQALAEEVGYTNASAFTRAFKKEIGVTPSAFLKNLEV